MKDNIRPDHYRKGEIDLYEAFSQIFPHNEYRAGMQMIAMRYMFRDKIDRVEDLNKAMETLERLREKEIEHREKQEKVKSNKTPEEAIVDMGKAFGSSNFDEWFREQKYDEPTKIAGQYLDEIYRYHDDLLKRLRSDDYDYLARDESGELWTHSYYPTKQGNKWRSISYVKRIYNDNFPEIQWTDDEPTKISELLASYENGGENGK